MHEPLPPEQVHIPTLSDMRRLIRAAEKYRRKKEWRRATVLRQTRVSLCLRAFERVLGAKYAGRKKGADRRWGIFARSESGEVVVVAYVGGGPTKRLEEVRAPIPIEVLDPFLVDVDALRAATRAQKISSIEGDT